MGGSFVEPGLRIGTPSHPTMIAPWAWGQERRARMQSRRADFRLGMTGDRRMLAAIRPFSGEAAPRPAGHGSWPTGERHPLPALP